MLCRYCLLSYLFSPLLFFSFFFCFVSFFVTLEPFVFGGLRFSSRHHPTTVQRGSRPPPPPSISKQYHRRAWAQNICPYWFDVYERLMETFFRVESSDSLYKGFVSLVEMWWWNYDRRICEEKQEIPFIRIASLDQPSTGKLQFGLCHI